MKRFRPFLTPLEGRIAPSGIMDVVTETVVVDQPGLSNTVSVTVEVDTEQPIDYITGTATIYIYSAYSYQSTQFLVDVESTGPNSVVLQTNPINVPIGSIVTSTSTVMGTFEDGTSFIQIISIDSMPSLSY